MSPVSLQASLILAGLTIILGAFIFVRLLVEFRSLKALRSRPDLEPILAEFATFRARLDSFKGRDWIVGKYVVRLFQKRLWDAAESPETKAKLLNKLQELNQLNLSASQIAYELESLPNRKQSAF